MAFLKMDYIYYSILEVLDNRPGKKFYIEEIWEDLLDNDFISHDMNDFTLNRISTMINADRTYYGVGYDPLDGNEVIRRCKKYKKDAYQVGCDGTHEMIEYRQLRKAFLSGFYAANGIIDDDPDENLEANALKAWGCYVQRIFYDNLENHLEQLKDIQEMRKGVREM